MILHGSTMQVTDGSGPRASGDDPQIVEEANHQQTVDPARAGMILAERDRGLARFRGPRASGDDPRHTVACSDLDRWTPRERG